MPINAPRVYFCPLLWLAAVPPPLASGYQPTGADFSVLANTVAELLRDRDPARFATNATITVPDLRALIDTNQPVDPSFPVMCENTVARERQKFAASARDLLTVADSLHLDFSKGDWRPHLIIPANFGTVRFNGMQAGDVGLDSAEKLEIAFTPDGPASATNGEFKIAMDTLIRFPGGWRGYEGIRWESFPSTVSANQTTAEIGILDKVTAHQSLTGHDDPALLALGNALAQFLQTGDVGWYQTNAMISPEVVWSLIQKAGHSVPLSDVAEQMQRTLEQESALAALVLRQKSDAGLNFTNATITVTDVTVDHAEPKGPPGSLDGLMGSGFTVTLNVKSDAKSKTGASIAGDYTLAADGILRADGVWRIANNLRWSRFPTNVVDAATLKRMSDEEYLAVHRALPPGTLAPDIEFITVDGEKKMRLSDLRGKVVILDFWATWCGPCQGPLAELQHLRDDHPDWGDKVAIVPISIDDAIATERKHLDQRGWTNTFNVWCGDGAFQSAPAQAFKLSAVPTTYIIDAQGKIIASGHPAGIPIAQTVDSLVKP